MEHTQFGSSAWVGVCVQMGFKWVSKTFQKTQNEVFAIVAFFKCLQNVLHL